MISLAAALIASAAPAATPADAFDQLKALQGIWINGEQPESPLRVHFTVTAGGSTVVEEWRAGERPHSLTIYTLDGDAILATHYCPQGNQPRLASQPGAPLSFNLRDVTGLDEGESHAANLDIMTDGTTITRRERYHKGTTPQDWSELKLVRQPEGEDRPAS